MQPLRFYRGKLVLKYAKTSFFYRAYKAVKGFFFAGGVGVFKACHAVINYKATVFFKGNSAVRIGAVFLRKILQCKAFKVIIASGNKITIF